MSNEYTFENFFAGNNNRTVKACAASIAECPSNNILNPFLILGSTGVGKTHLLKAIKNKILASQGELAVCYINCEDLSDVMKFSGSDFLNANNDTKIFLLDDFHYKNFSNELQEIVYRILYSIYSKGKQIVIASKAQEIHLYTGQLSSFLKCGVTAYINQPDFIAKTEILRAEASRHDLNLTYHVIVSRKSKIIIN